jgi:hypothetical protein
MLEGRQDVIATCTEDDSNKPWHGIIDMAANDTHSKKAHDQTAPSTIWQRWTSRSSSNAETQQAIQSRHACFGANNKVMGMDMVNSPKDRLKAVVVFCKRDECRCCCLIGFAKMTAKIL